MSDVTEVIHAMHAAAAAGEWLTVDDLAASLPLSPDSDLVVELLGILRDDVVGLDVQFGLVHAAEGADKLTYVGGVLRALPSLLCQSRDWVKTITVRILNSETYLNCLVGLVSDAPPEQRAAILAAIDIVESEGNPQIADKIQTLRRSF